MSELSFPFYTSAVKNDLDDVGNLLNMLQKWARDNEVGSLNHFFKARLVNANQSIPTGTWTRVLFDSMVEDDGDNYDLYVKNAYVCPTDGLYIFSASLLFDTSVADGSPVSIYLYKNGAFSERGMDIPIGAANYAGVCMSAVVKASAKDYFGIAVYQNSGSSEVLLADEPARLNWFSGARLQKIFN
jgi:hypothetical protein